MNRGASLSVAITALAVPAIALWVPPLAQDPAYHRLADTRALLGVPNVMDVVSNLGFLVVGLYGLARARRLAPGVPAQSYALFCVMVSVVSAGSAWYHLAPDNATLLWDRLPIAAAFMALFAMVIGDRVNPGAGRMLLWPLVTAGVLAVLYWHWTESLGRGVLRPYLLVQFLPVVLIAVLLLSCPRGVLRNASLWAMLGAYALAKATELLDRDIFEATALVSGHTLKHLLAALAALAAVRAAPLAARSDR